MWATGTHAYDKEQKLSPIYFKVHVAGCIISSASFIALNDAPYGREGVRGNIWLCCSPCVYDAPSRTSSPVVVVVVVGGGGGGHVV